MGENRRWSFLSIHLSPEAAKSFDALLDGLPSNAEGAAAALAACATAAKDAPDPAARELHWDCVFLANALAPPKL